VISVFLLVILTITGLIHWYLWARLVKATTRPGRWRRIGTALIVAAVLLILVTLFARGLRPAQQRWIAWPGYVWLSVMFLTLSVLVVLEPVRLALRRWSRRPAPVPAAVSRGTLLDENVQQGAPAYDPARRLFLGRALALTAGVAAVGTTAFGVHTAMGPPQLLRRQIGLSKLPRTMDGFRIALVSDIHLGPLLGRGHTERIVDTINRLDADLVAVVGDLVDGSVADLGNAAEPLARLRARHGSYFVTGNHEYFSGYEEWIPEIESFGLTVLRNRRTEIEGLDLAGVNDVTGASQGDAPDYDKALGGRDSRRPVVLLAHQPVQVHEAARRGVDVQLSGHTHGGQIFPFGYLVRLQQPVLAGYARIGPTQLYVTRGAGFWGPPVRVGAPPDISLIELRTT
jgi:predicted MPP superfamily phosphohydrolase